MSLISALANTYVLRNDFESLSQVTDMFVDGFSAIGAYGGNFTDRPRAFLSYIVFDSEMNYVDSDFLRLKSDDAGFEPGQPYSVDFEELKDDITVSQNGYIYVYVSNETPGVNVWFDDLTVSRKQNIVKQATDYGVWGDVTREQKSDESIYRYAYQGGFSERDEETGWNHFELREFDPIVGRWTSIDTKANSEWGLKEFVDGKNAYPNPNRAQDNTNNTETGVTILGVRNEKAKANIHFHYCQLCVESPSVGLDGEGWDSEHVGKNVYNVEISNNRIWFYNRYKMSNNPFTGMEQKEKWGWIFLFPTKTIATVKNRSYETVVNYFELFFINYWLFSTFKGKIEIL